MRRVGTIIALGTMLIATMPVLTPPAAAESSDVQPCAATAVVITEYNINVASSG